MPPRIQSQRIANSLSPYLSSSSSTYSSTITISSSSCTRQSCPSPPLSHSFSSTPIARVTKQRREMFAWLNSPDASVLKNHIPGQTNYFLEHKQPESTKRPFIMNKEFVSESILSEELRNEIHKRVMVDKKSVRAVSVEMGVDMRRVAAVCRLIEVEKKWKQQGKPLALPYARAVHEMVPTTPLYERPADQRLNPHESINDLPADPLTDAQIFYPVSESRQFNRIDAGRVFSAAPALEHKSATKATDPYEAVSRITENPSRIETIGKGDDVQRVLQPADVRIPHPHLVAHERMRISKPGEARAVWEAYNQRIQKADEADEARRRAAEERRESQITRVKPEDSRFEFVIKDVVFSKETTGADGRGAKAPGRRYGVPSYDRKKGQVKIPRRVVV
ncbi:eukaryotic mitochondrial regulator protein-domain-containing protein [Aspergillus egyptiacus]|nr:eukaryotic mitochondrial regulator protein-domain-containing protein [Aspergillus egyptiacus]